MKPALAFCAVLTVFVAACSSGTPVEGDRARPSPDVSLAEAVRMASCDIKTAEASYRGPCRFNPDEGGTFFVEAPDSAALLEPIGDNPGVLSVTVAMVAPGGAEVSGLTSDGINSRWGSATRSLGDPSCRVGDGFTICVR